MSRLNRGLISLAAAIAIGLWVSPATAGKLTLNDEELDKVSASGTPTILESGNGSPITFSDTTMYTLDFDVPDAQTGIRALTIQNIVGEQQLLVNLNVLSAINNVAGTDQRNFSLQSWGGTAPDPNTVKAVDGVAAAPCVGNNACQGTGGSGGVAQGDGGSGGSVIVTAGGVAGAGGSGGTNTNNAPGGSASVTTGNASTSPGIVNQAASASGDLIATSGNGSSITVNRDPMYTLAFTASRAQSDLAALFVSNVVGESQMAMNLNIASATLNLVPEPNTPFTAGFQNATGVIKQVNMGLQFRGTPLSGSTGTLTNFNLGVTAENK